MRPIIETSVSSFDGALDLSGYIPAQRNAKAHRAKQVLEASRLLGDVEHGRVPDWYLREAFRPSTSHGLMALQERYPGMMTLRENPVGGMSITDFSALTVDVLDRMMYGYWNAYPILTMPLVKQHTLRDFRNVSRYLIDGATTPPEAVAPGAEPKEKKLINNTAIQYAPLKYEAFTRVVWEAMVNDDLGIFNDLAQRLIIGARRGIDMFITQLYLASTGLNTSMYTTAFKNIINTTNGAASNNPPLTIQGLQDAFKVLARQVDADGYPIVMSGRMILWYGPALTATAQNLMHMLTAQLSVNGGTANVQGFPTQFIEVNNWAVQNMTTLMNPYIPLVATSGTVANTLWGITLEQDSQNRPAAEFGFLRGFETPQIFAKAPNTMRPGGGLDASLGDFYTMAQELKVLTVYGGKVIAGESTVASDGSGT
jgi:hypothetical protein